MKLTHCLLWTALALQSSALSVSGGSAASDFTPKAQIDTKKALAELALKEEGKLLGSSEPSVQINKQAADISSEVTATSTYPKTSIQDTKKDITASVAATNGKTSSQDAAISVDDNEKLPPDAYHSFFMSTSMILLSEVGDKTFLIAALMAMRSDRIVVFTAAFSSLAIMTVLSGIVGHALPALIPQRATQFLASILFVVFGFKLLKEGLAMSKDLGVDEELAEVEEEIASTAISNQLNQVGGLTPKHTNQPWYKVAANNFSNLVGFILSPTWVQVFVMTFLGEWGDRSQIATIAMAAGSDYWFVILGAIVGHGICTCAACIGGKFLATRISMRTVTLGGSAAFFVFAVLYLYDAISN